MTMTTTLDLDALEAIAAAATPGPWQPYASQPEVSVMCSGKVLASIEVRNGFGWRDMEHIAAFSPTTAKALIARVRELEGQIEMLRTTPRTQHDISRAHFINSIETAIERVKKKARRHI